MIVLLSTQELISHLPEEPAQEVMASPLAQSAAEPITPSRLLTFSHPPSRTPRTVSVLRPSTMLREVSRASPTRISHSLASPSTVLLLSKIMRTAPQLAHLPLVSPLPASLFPTSRVPFHPREPMSTFFAEMDLALDGPGLVSPLLVERLVLRARTFLLELLVKQFRTLARRLFWPVIARCRGKPVGLVGKWLRGGAQAISRYLDTFYSSCQIFFPYIYEPLCWRLVIWRCSIVRGLDNQTYCFVELDFPAS